MMLDSIVMMIVMWIRCEGRFYDAGLIMSMMVLMMKMMRLSTEMFTMSTGLPAVVMMIVTSCGQDWSAVARGTSTMIAMSLHVDCY